MLRLLLALALALALLAAPARAVEPTPAGPVLGSLIAHMLSRGHYERRPLDAAMSAKFLDNLIESYDYNRMYFMKSDVDGFVAEYGETSASGSAPARSGPPMPSTTGSWNAWPSGARSDGAASPR